jgi:very-short-patch-repair endonuclease
MKKGQRIQRLLLENYSNTEIQKQISCSDSTIRYHRRQLGLPGRKGKSTAIELPWSEVQEYYNNDHSLAETAEYFGVSSEALSRAADNGKWIKRSKSKNDKLARQKYPRIFTQDSRAKLRKAMLDRRQSGYNWTFAHSRKNKESYPESFFKSVIKNELIDQCYHFNYPYGRYALDFAWLHKKKCIEIDGDQHLYNEDQRKSDIRKDAYLNNSGWQVLRIRWKDFCRDTKYWIDQAKIFIDN